MTQSNTAKLSKLLPPSLGTLFGQPFEKVDASFPLPNPPASLPGARSASELCCLVDQYDPDLLRGDEIAEVKLDGIRCLYIAGRLWTREGSPFEAAEDCLPILQAMERAYGQPMFFDGEFVEEGGLESTLSAFRSRKSKDGCLWLFDAVPFDQWQSGKASREPLVTRKWNLRRVLLDVTDRERGVPVGYIEHVDRLDRRLVEHYSRDLWASGFEGLVIKRSDSFYLRKRTCDWMKVKIRTVSTMQVVDVAGCFRNGRDEAKALLVRLPGRQFDHSGAAGPPNRTVRISVPSGGLAETIWNNRSDLISRGNIDVEHAGFTGAGNPREATLKSVRY